MQRQDIMSPVTGFPGDIFRWKGITLFLLMRMTGSLADIDVQDKAGNLRVTGMVWYWPVHLSMKDFSNPSFDSNQFWM